MTKKMWPAPFVYLSEHLQPWQAEYQPDIKWLRSRIPLVYQVIQTFHPATFFARVLRRHKKADLDDRLR
ncbi:hypothetical protein [Pseudomonas fluorescens]|uniref:hypothetical protein n=1 Tax=Pseudomonas fluorescens TaxID=294 RepID=UPI003823E6AF